jgi:death-on-curing family protein
LIKNHPWLGGNKRTATTLLRRFLELNGYRKKWTVPEQIELVLAVESDEWKVDEIENWLRKRVKKL